MMMANWDHTRKKCYDGGAFRRRSSGYLVGS
jgi:hypothetical protein